jgi:hypothetical protein
MEGDAPARGVERILPKGAETDDVALVAVDQGAMKWEWLVLIRAVYRHMRRDACIQSHQRCQEICNRRLVGLSPRADQHVVTFVARRSN